MAEVQQLHDQELALARSRVRQSLAWVEVWRSTYDARARVRVGFLKPVFTGGPADGVKVGRPKRSTRRKR